MTEAEVKVIVADEITKAQVVTKGFCDQCQAREKAITDSLEGWMRSISSNQKWMLALSATTLITMLGFFASKVIHSPVAQAAIQ